MSKPTRYDDGVARYGQQIMDTFPKPGEYVKFLGENSFFKGPLGIQTGDIVKIFDIEVGNSSSEIYLPGYTRGFNIVLFARIPSNEEIQRLTDALNYAILLIEWHKPVEFSQLQEHIGHYPRYERALKPNKKAGKRANEIRQMAGFDQINYKEKYGDK